MSREFFDFSWRVANGGYQWVKATRFREPQGKPERFLTDGVPITDTYRKWSYQRLKDNSALFVTFAALTPGMKEDAVKFANDYGLLGEEIPIYYRSKDATLGSVVVLGDSEDFWTNEVIAMKSAVSLWGLLRENKGEIRKLIYWKGKSEVRYRSSRLSEIIASPHVNRELFQQFTPGEFIRPAWYYLQHIINEHLSGRLSPRLLREGYKSKDELLWGLSFFPSTLIGALWLQFAQAVVGERQYRSCLNCGKPFILSPDTARTNRRHCSPSCRTQVWRKRKKAKSQAQPSNTKKHQAKTK